MASENPEWYQKLCAQFVSSRKKGYRSSRTAIKRRETLRALRRIADDKGPIKRQYNIQEPRYIALMLPIIEFELKHDKPVDEAPVELVPVGPSAQREDWELW